jgi:hypothetical protein
MAVRRYREAMITILTIGRANPAIADFGAVIAPGLRVARDLF